MSKEEQEKREVLALVSWLQTFDQFPFSVVDGIDGDIKERFNIVLESLENVKISRAVVHVAEEVCGLHRNDIGSHNSASQIWRAMLNVTTIKSRFEIYTTPENASSDAEIPHVVLSNLLDFAVTSPDLDERRKYIQRIMSLSKSVQKILMNLIERMKKTLPRKPKNSSRSSRGVRSPRMLCGPNNDAVIDGPDAPIPDPGNKPFIKNCARKKQDSHLFVDDDSSAGASDVTPPPQETSQRVRAFGSPRRERNVHGIPQTESQDRSRGRSNQQDHQRSRSASHVRHQDHQDHEGSQSSKPRQPEGHYMPELTKKRCQKGFASPPRDRQQRKQKGFASPGKQRHSTGTSNGSQNVPFRERQVQTQQRAAFASINNQNQRNQKQQQQQQQPQQHHGTLSRKGGTQKPGPPPPPPPYSLDQKMPASSTPSDELEIDNHLSLPLTDTTLSTVDTTSSLEAGSDLAVLKVNSSTDTKQRQVGRGRQGDAFSSPARRVSLLDSPVPIKTPDVSLTTQEREVDGRMMFSPDDSVLQSPLQVDDFVKDLRAKNKSLESILQSYQKRERELNQKMESTESKLRKEMMKLESRALGREDELRRSYDTEMAKLKKDLRTEKEKNKASMRAKEELANANDELDLMQHTHEKLLEATEKIRKYKERIDSMNDYKEALEREQEAHSESVEECLRLQNELKVLQPLKRQLEDYKAKAVDAEVQLAECKDALAKLERERSELNGKRDDVIREARAQRAQADELRKFIRLKETQDGPGIGEGISELNPELYEELVKLRNENERLRVFAEERTDDSVQRLQENLEDSTVRQERFKAEYLKSKNKLEETESLLSTAKQRLAQLEAEIVDKDKAAEEYQRKIKFLEDQYNSCLETLESLQQRIGNLEEQKSVLETELDEWKEMAEKLEKELEKRTGELESTKDQLKETEDLKRKVEADVAEWKIMSDKLEADLKRRAAELDGTKQTLQNTEEAKAQIERDLAEWKQMADKLDIELVKKNDELEQARQTLFSMEEEQMKQQHQLNEWIASAEKLREELKAKEMEVEETKTQLNETREMLHASGQRQEELMNHINDYEKRLQEADEKYQKLDTELQETSSSLKAAEASVEEGKKREENLNEESRQLKEVSETLLKQLKEETKAKEEISQESHRTLEATREVLNSKAKKELEELQANMNRLLDDERKAYRMKADKASVDYKKLQEKYEMKLKVTMDECSARIKDTEENSMRRMAQLQDQTANEIEKIKQQEDEKRTELKQRLEELLQGAKNGAEAALKELWQQKEQTSLELATSQEQYNQLASKYASKKERLEYATNTIIEMETLRDDLNDTVTKLQREKTLLQEESDKYRRQLGGQRGTDHSQVDKLNKELMDAHHELQDLKRKLAKSASQDTSMSFQSESNSSHLLGSYSSGAANQSALVEVKAGYEEEAARLNEEKREMVMKYSSATVEVQKVTQALHQRDQEITKLKAELTAVKLDKERAEMAVTDEEENREASFFYQDTDTSFGAPELQGTFSSDIPAPRIEPQQRQISDSRENREASFYSHYRDTDTSFGSPGLKESFSSDIPAPRIEPQQRQISDEEKSAFSTGDKNVNVLSPSNKLELQRQMSHSRQQNEDGSRGEQVLTPSKKHENNAGAFSRAETASPSFASKARVYELHIQKVNKKSPDRARPDIHRPMKDFTQQLQADQMTPGDGDGQTECTQS
ncbi:expressed unknown protein [Seminavis robusta]|uniref:Uncharacterized protein n=1 Tax=Seminavis robusta TaxID=568900 RepID=A0A9N8DQB9_9STRA|nr:expressed unknown protein [Seminavis robusta]|eukprot:Sro264_g102500.1 n/a (1702) ;mRNA; r:27101-32405